MAVSEKEWRETSRERIREAVRSAGRVSMRELMRLTHHDRGPVGLEEPGNIWFRAFEDLETAGFIRLETANGKRLKLWETEYRQRVWVLWAKN
jgi:hypothetical protein